MTTILLKYDLKVLDQSYVAQATVKRALLLGFSVVLVIIFCPASLVFLLDVISNARRCDLLYVGGRWHLQIFENRQMTLTFKFCRRLLGPSCPLEIMTLDEFGHDYYTFGYGTAVFRIYQSYEDHCTLDRDNSHARCSSGSRKDGKRYLTTLEGRQLLRQAVREGDLREPIDTYRPGRSRQTNPVQYLLLDDAPQPRDISHVPSATSEQGGNVFGQHQS